MNQNEYFFNNLLYIDSQIIFYSKICGEMLTWIKKKWNYMKI